MNASLQPIRDAIDTFDLETARALLKTELEGEPTSEAYYLASLVALSKDQKVSFLEKALEQDPENVMAIEALRELEYSSVLPRLPNDSKSKNQMLTSYLFADILRRFASYVIDNVLLFIIGYASGYIYATLFAPEYSGIRSTYSSYVRSVELFQLSAIALGLFINILYVVVFFTRNNGQTIGKRVMKIRVRKRNGQPITYRDAFLRNVVGYFVSTIFFLLGFIWASFDENRQAWHDKMADTVVVND